MKALVQPPEIRNLFANSKPDEVWATTADIVRRINPAHDFFLAQMAFDDVVRLFRGEYPGYCAIRTLYHDLPHTLDVLLCAARLMHGMHVSGMQLTDTEINWVMIAALLHDIGYAQRQEEAAGSGAQYTHDHVSRGIAFMQRYLADRHFPPSFAAHLEPMILSTNPALDFSEINFPDARSRLLAQIVGTADLVGQMADRTYLEKLLFLFLEFKEAHFGNYKNSHDLLRQTRGFYETTREKKLNAAFGAVYTKLELHFKDYFGTAKNYYIESIEKNIAYLSQVISHDEEEHLSLLRRGGIAEQTRRLQ